MDIFTDQFLRKLSFKEHTLFINLSITLSQFILSKTFYYNINIKIIDYYNFYLLKSNVIIVMF